MRVLGRPPANRSGKFLPDWCGVTSGVSAAADSRVVSGSESLSRFSVTMTRSYCGKKVLVAFIDN